MRERDWTDYDVLVVDDESDNLDAFRFAFRKSFRLHYAEGAAAALAMLGDLEPAVIVADQRMPGMSGIELLRRMSERHPDVVCVLISDLTHIELALTCLNEGLAFQIVLNISLSDIGLAIPPFTPTLDLSTGWQGVKDFFSAFDLENF